MSPDTLWLVGPPCVPQYLNISGYATVGELTLPLFLPDYYACFYFNDSLTIDILAVKNHRDICTTNVGSVDNDKLSAVVAS